VAGILQGVRILEVATWVAAPSAGAVMADWGAEVIKVENPEGGDAIRGFTSIEGFQGGDIWWQLLNRGKKSIALNLSTEEGQAVLHRLAAASDVLLTNLQIGLLDRFRLDFPTLHEVNPRLVYGLLSGYGYDGPDRHLPGYDYSAYWARSGIMEHVSEPGRPPRPARPGIGDNSTSMVIAAGLSAALFHRERTGEGQEVHFSLYHSAVWAIGMDVQAALSFGAEIPHANPDRARNPLWNTYKTSDDLWFQMVMLQSDRFWPRFCEVIERPALLQDPRFDSHASREQHSEALVAIIKGVAATRPREEWEQRFKDFNLVGGRVQRVIETASDPQALANGFFTETERGDGSTLPLVSSPVKFRQNPASVDGPAPELGQNTEEVLLDVGAYEWEELERLKEQGVIPW
jgi:crotonobetainyl-CoA:carnitine CoA-transferase CaiB-like acyl-CoA transferase